MEIKSQESLEELLEEIKNLTESYVVKNGVNRIEIKLDARAQKYKSGKIALISHDIMVNKLEYNSVNKDEIIKTL